jgi:hypothetical protein
VAAADIAATVTEEGLPAAYDAEARGMQGLPSGFPRSCSAFIKSDGTYGSWGQAALREIAKHPAFLENWRSSSAACRNFNSFTDAQKRHFWVYLLAAVAARESTCQLDVDSPASINPNGVASGLYQIENKSSLRAGRDIQWGGRYCSGDPYSLEVNTRCGVKMLEDVIDNGDGPYSSRNNYWSSLINSRTSTKVLVSQYEDCGNARLSATRSRSKYRSRHHRSHR